MPYKIYCSGKGDASVLQRGDYEIAAPAAHEVQIEHAAVGLNFIDIYFRTGLYPGHRRRKSWCWARRRRVP